jgi:hypothetical protein
MSNCFSKKPGKSGVGRFEKWGGAALFSMRQQSPEGAENVNRCRRFGWREMKSIQNRQGTGIWTR